MSVTYNPSSVTVKVPYIHLDVSPSSPSLGENIDLKVSTGESGMCIYLWVSYNGGTFSRLEPGAVCPFQTDSNGNVSASVSAAKEGTYTFYASMGVESNHVSVTVSAPTLSLSLQDTRQKTGSTFTFTATLTDSGGNPMPGVAVTFKDKTTNVIPSDAVVTTDSNGEAIYSHKLWSQYCPLSGENFNWDCFIIVGANNVSVTSNTVTAETYC